MGISLTRRYNDPIQISIGLQLKKPQSVLADLEFAVVSLYACWLFSFPLLNGVSYPDMSSARMLRALKRSDK